VIFPLEQTCCGLPLKTTGNQDAAEMVALQNIETLNKAKVDYIVTLCASCASFLKKGYLDLFADCDEELMKSVHPCSEKIITSGEFIKKVMGKINSPASFKGEDVTFHTPCHMRELSNSKESAIDV